MVVAGQVLEILPAAELLHDAQLDCPTRARGSCMT
jgi:hypothetical protein